jgi:hypothetical protein
MTWKGLSLTAPWPWIILNLGKRVENRDWPTTFRGPFLLHASKGMTKADWYAAHDFVAAFDPEGAARIPKPDDPALLRGHIVARAELVGLVSPGWKLRKREIPRPDWEEKQKRWYMGSYGFMLAHVRPTSSVPAKGSLGFWNVPAALAAAAFGRPAGEARP